MVNIFIPKTIMLSGFDVHPTTGEGLQVTINLMLMVAIFAFSTIRKWVREDRVKKTIVAMDAAGHQRKFSKLVLNVWDHSMTDIQEVEDLKGSITQQLKMLLHFRRKQLGRRLKVLPAAPQLLISFVSRKAMN